MPHIMHHVSNQHPAVLIRCYHARCQCINFISDYFHMNYHFSSSPVSFTNNALKLAYGNVNVKHVPGVIRYSRIPALG